MRREPKFDNDSRDHVIGFPKDAVMTGEEDKEGLGGEPSVVETRAPLRLWRKGQEISSNVEVWRGTETIRPHGQQPAAPVIVPVSKLIPVPAPVA